MSPECGIEKRRVAETPLAVIDLETTGLAPGGDRVVEISIIRHDPGRQPALVFDTLVNPERRVAATKIHGIKDADVQDAPRFADIVGDVVKALAGSVVAAYNVYFDEPFLSYELERQRAPTEFPYMCLMYMRPLLNLGKRCKLDAACAEHGIPMGASHVAGTDAEAASRLLLVYLEAMRERGIETFGELARLKSYKFVDSFFCAPLEPVSSLPRGARLKSRYSPGTRGTSTPSAMSVYWDELATILSDLEVTSDELDSIAVVRKKLGLSAEQVRVLHARAFATAMNAYGEDEWLDDVEARRLQKLSDCLTQLGWAPGEPPTPRGLHR